MLDKTGQVYDLGVGKIEIIGLAEVGPPVEGVPDPAYYAEDHDNYFDIMLKGDAAAMSSLLSVEIPPSAVAGYRDIYNQGVPGRPPSPTTIYHKAELPPIGRAPER